MHTQEDSLTGARWLLVNPVDTAQLNSCISRQPGLTSQPSLVVYDNLGAGEGDIIGFVEGAEATAPFEQPTPIDAISLAIFDTLHYEAPTH
ncbi:ethanolamine utilization protein EutN [Verrucomicrobiaceae bacterium N1E253]|uniref:Ethanolamine utilization protein EutN n=2 Tax=Oceaniferula marina TaxID=2748318 RepID=A0A851GK13_9BACT|nr:ethanolamine utilization protein EutN [Oceaniferula marina]